MIASAFIGSATWFLRPWLEPPGFPPLPPLVCLHGIVFTGWAALFMTQASLVSTGRTDLHRKLGMAGMAFAVVLPIIGLFASLSGALRASGPPGIPPMTFLAVPLLSIPAYAFLLVAALRARRDPRSISGSRCLRWRYSPRPGSLSPNGQPDWSSERGIKPKFIESMASSPS